MFNGRFPIEKIISGGQTGADRAATDFAIKHRIDWGGRIPKGRLAENGPIPTVYTNYKETRSSNYSERTRKNVVDSDGTVIISHGELTGGSLLTSKIANDEGKPCLHINLLAAETHKFESLLKQWIKENCVLVLNVAGPRQSGDPSIYAKTQEILTLLID